MTASDAKKGKLVAVLQLLEDAKNALLRDPTEPQDGCTCGLDHGYEREVDAICSLQGRLAKQVDSMTILNLRATHHSTGGVGQA